MHALDTHAHAHACTGQLHTSTHPHHMHTQTYTHTRAHTHMHRTTFWVDFISSVPWEPIVAGGLGLRDRETLRAKLIALLRWLRVGRMYPIFDVFAVVQHRHLLPPFALTLTRNYVSGYPTPDCKHAHKLLHANVCTYMTFSLIKVGSLRTAHIVFIFPFLTTHMRVHTQTVLIQSLTCDGPMQSLICDGQMHMHRTIAGKLATCIPASALPCLVYSWGIAWGIAWKRGPVTCNLA